MRIVLNDYLSYISADRTSIILCAKCKNSLLPPIKYRNVQFKRAIYLGSIQLIHIHTFNIESN